MSKPNLVAAVPVVREYPSARVRGLADWRPQAKTRALLEHVNAVLTEYAAHLPLTCRQIFYRLVGAYDYAKNELAYERLLEALNRARRAGLVPFEAIRDDGVTESLPGGFSGKAGFWRAVSAAAEGYMCDRLTGQAVAIELWVEASGMVPQAARVAHPYGVPVYSSGGFDSLSAKHAAAERIGVRKVSTVILHVGDYDPSGLSIFDAATDDIAAMLQDTGVDAGLAAIRVAVTPEQIARYGLPEAAAKATDRRGAWAGGTVQAEALRPDDLAEEIERAIVARLDLDVWRATVAREAADRTALKDRVREIIGEGTP